MEKIKGYNRNLCNGKRPHKKIQRYGKYKTLGERMMAESKALMEYQKRVGQR
ncbi:MAG TPA: hypothetical protein VNX68_07640 [Nitrosopumilaceae archaeon]|jgi:hypothetical protein|nr:hypothetical protein [Nitrosopumilaceae archaeon]